MFFSLSKTTDPRFPNQVQIGSWIFNHDNGWHHTDQSWHKGYCYDNLSHGNHCRFRYVDDKIYLEHDRDRSFPLFWNENDRCLSNCGSMGAQKLYCDDLIYLDHDSIHTTKHDVIGITDIPMLTVDQVVDAIHANLSRKFEQLARSQVPIKLFVTGGIDTVCLWSYVNSFDINCDVLDYQYFAYDHFTNHCIGDIRKLYWGYNQLHHWTQPTILLSGACGDEFTFRGPTAIAIWSSWHDIDFADLVGRYPGYHQHYFLLEKNIKIFRDMFSRRDIIKELYPTRSHLIRHLIDMNLNDHQHWHLGETITWTPFKDIEIFKIMLSLDPDTLIAQFVDAAVSKKLIQPQYRRFLSTHKNHLSRTNLLT